MRRQVAINFATFPKAKPQELEKVPNGLAIWCQIGYPFEATSFSDPVPFGSAFDLQLCRAAAFCGR